MKLEDLLHRARQHVTDSAGFITAATPLGAFLENVLAGMADEVSFKSRVIVGGLFLGGLGGGLGYVRDRSRRLFHITDKTKERYQQIHDMAYIAAATLSINPFIYAAAGARDAKEIVLGTLFSAGVALASGGLIGYSVDLFRDLTGYKPSHRIPGAVRNMRPGLKKTLAAGILAASMSLTGLVYHLTPDLPPETSITASQTQVLEGYSK